MCNSTILCLVIVLLSSSCNAQVSNVDLPSSLVLVPSATDINSSTEGFLHDGCTNLAYVVQERYPGTATQSLISKDLQSRHWFPESRLDKQEITGSSRHPNSLGKWTHFKNVAGTATYVRKERWSNRDGDVTSYVLRYFAPDLRTIHVEGRYCPARVINKYRCAPGPLPAHDDKAYSVELQITRIERLDKDFRVFVYLQNNGSKPVLLGLNGSLADGVPELWVLGLEQQESGDWMRVDAVCPEHPPLDWVDLKPGKSIESWAMAVDFEKPDQYFGKCRRKIGHLRLNSSIRAVIRYYVDACEIEQPLESRDPHFAVSTPRLLVESR